MHYKLEAEGVVQCLISGTSHLTSDVLRQLLAFAPDEREVCILTRKKKINVYFELHEAWAFVSELLKS